MDAIVNFLTATLGASATNVATSLTVTTGHGARFGNTFPYDVVVYDSAYSNAALAYHAGAAEIVRVTARSTDTLTVTRARQSTSALALGSGWNIIQAPTQDLMSQLVPESLFTTRGDTIRRGASATERLALGANGTVLASDGTDPNYIGLGGGDVWSASTTNWERWMLPFATATVARAMSAGRFYAIPFFVSQPATASKLAINVTTLGSGSNARVGLYLSTSVADIYPGSLMVDGGEISTASIGVKEYNISQALTPNRWHWLTALFSTTAPSCTGFSTFAGNIGVDTAFAIANVFYATQSYGALPSTFPTAGITPTTSGTFPCVAIKLSSIT